MSAEHSDLEHLSDDQMEVAKDLANEVLGIAQEVDHPYSPEIIYCALKLAYMQWRMLLLENYGPDYLIEADRLFDFKPTSTSGNA